MESTKEARRTIVDREAGRFYVTLDGSINVDGTRPIGPAIVSVRIEQTAEIEGQTFRANALFFLDGRHQWGTPAKFLDGDVAGFVGKHYRAATELELEIPFFETYAISNLEGSLAFGSKDDLEAELDRELAEQNAGVVLVDQDDDDELAEAMRRALAATVETGLSDGTDRPVSTVRELEEVGR